MAACRRRVVYLLLTLLFLVDTSFSSKEGNIDRHQLSDDALYRVKRAAVPGEINMRNPSNQNVLKQLGQRFGTGDVDRNAGGTGNNIPLNPNNAPFQSAQPHFGRGNVGRGFPMNQGGGGAGLGAGSMMNNPAPGVPAANNHYPGGDALNKLGNVPVKPKKPSKIKISTSDECAADVQKFCSKGVKDNNFSILDCLQSDERVMHCEVDSLLILYLLTVIFSFLLENVQLTSVSHVDTLSHISITSQFMSD